MKGIKAGTRAILVRSVDLGRVALADGCRGVVTHVVLFDITDDGREVFAYNFKPDGAVPVTSVPEEALIPEDPRTGLELMLENAKIIQRDIEQIFIDCESWNNNSVARKNGAAPVEADPDGQLSRQLGAISRHIAELETRLALPQGGR